MEKKKSNFTITELCKSNTAKLNNILNNPTAEHESNLKTLIIELLDPIRELYGKPIMISSGYRSEELNKKIGGSKTSNHSIGCAADLACDTIETRDEIYDIAKQFKYDELYKESRDKKDKNGKIIGKSYWVHVAYRKNGNRMKNGIIHNDIFIYKNF